MPLATLGFFVFHTATIPYHGIDRSQSWRHPHKSIVGNDSPPPSQYTGKEPDTITIQAELRPEVTGGDMSINLLRSMADGGKPWPLILGTGQLLGSYVITDIQDKQSQLMYDGKARAISFSMSLKKIADHAFGLEGEALGLAVGMVRSLVGV